jgi:ubiquinone biosynthesis O-methyltransferase
MNSIRKSYDAKYDYILKSSLPGIHEKIIEYKNIIKGKTVLDIGCGAGRLSFFTAKYAKKVDAFDISLTAIKIARNIAVKNNIKNIHFFVSNFENYEIKNNYYDVILVSEVFEHVKNQKKFVKKLNNSIKQNGFIILSSPNYLNMFGLILYVFSKLGLSISDQQIEKFLTPITMKNAFKSFKLQKIIGTNYRIGWFDLLYPALAYSLLSGNFPNFFKKLYKSIKSNSIKNYLQEKKIFSTTLFPFNLLGFDLIYIYKRT